MDNTQKSDQIAGLPDDVKDAWKKVTGLIYGAGRRDGYQSGVKVTTEQYTLSFRALLSTLGFFFGFFIGGLFGMVVATVLQHYLMKG